MQGRSAVRRLVGDKMGCEQEKSTYKGDEASCSLFE